MVSADSEEEEVEALLALAEDEGLAEDLVGSDEPLDFFGDAKEELEDGLLFEASLDLDE